MTERLNRVFGALADPTRRAILARVAEGESSVNELARPFDMSRPAVSKHIRILEEAGLVSRRREGRVHRVMLDPRSLRNATEWLDFYRVFWSEQLDSLADHLQRRRP